MFNTKSWFIHLLTGRDCDEFTERVCRNYNYLNKDIVYAYCTIRSFCSNVVRENSRNFLV